MEAEGGAQRPRQREGSKGAEAPHDTVLYRPAKDSGVQSNDGCRAVFDCH